MTEQSPFTLDRELIIEKSEDGWQANSSDVYWNSTAAFGGWLNALAIKAVMQSEGFRGNVISQQTVFMNPVVKGPIHIRPEILKQGKRSDFWRVDLFQNDRLAVTMHIYTGERRGSDLDYQAEKPQPAPISESLPILPAPPLTPVWMSEYDQHLAKGKPFSKNPTPESWLWSRDKDERPLDILSLIAMLDTPMPRTFFVAEQLRMGSTATMANYIYANDADLEAAGGDHLLLRCSSASVRNGNFDQRVEAWSSTGALLAVSNQIAVYR